MWALFLISYDPGFQTLLTIVEVYSHQAKVLELSPLCIVLPSKRISQGPAVYPSENNKLRIHPAHYRRTRGESCCHPENTSPLKSLARSLRKFIKLLTWPLKRAKSCLDRIALSKIHLNLE